MKQIELVFKQNVEPSLRSNAENRLHICNSCSKHKYDAYAQDIGVCDVCGKKNEIATPCIYDKITNTGYKIRED